jgi:hypothetical protein
MKFPSLKPKSKSNNQLKQDSMKEKTITVVREDGKEVLIVTSQLANHLDRGFTLKKGEKMPKEVTEEKEGGFSDTTAATKAKKAKKAK